MNPESNRFTMLAISRRFLFLFLCPSLRSGRGYPRPDPKLHESAQQFFPIRPGRNRSHPFSPFQQCLPDGLRLGGVAQACEFAGETFDFGVLWLTFLDKLTSK